ncbi:protein LONGIFOLIA 1-like [Musa acuminata AAA Group]|uniref:protein LONGIFOLIA 1-like n=1 Tax=Musa acuminata AAA Group TaxID=214697 RepID=UPI0031DABF64
MRAKLLDAFTDENMDLQKQIGCIAGIFQMFDRHHLLIGKRLNDHNHRKLPSGHVLPKNGRQESEQKPRFSQILQEKNLSKSLNETQTASMESSRASCSSSSSSYSSLESVKASRQEACSFDRAFFQEKSLLANSPKVKKPEDDAKSISFDSCSSTPKAILQTLDFHNAVRDPIKKGAQGFPTRTASTEKVNNHEVKHKDSPRPVLLAKTRMPADLNEAIRLLVELKEAPWSFRDHEANDTSFYQESRRSPRFSYDGRELSRLSMDSQDNSKPANKLRELPRLSLDSRRGAQRSSNFASRTSSTLEDFDKTTTSPSVNRASNLLQDLSQKRQPSIVAKLMGLDEMLGSNSAAQAAVARKSCAPSHEPRDCTSATRPRGTREAKGDQLPHAVQSRDSTIAKPKDHRSLLKHKSKIMTETAPWTQQTPQKARTGYQEAQFIYQEIEERLKGPKFQQQKKDLRALKQIVAAMHAKRLAQTTKDNDHPYKISVLEDYADRTPRGSTQNSRSPKVWKQPAQEGGSPKAFDPPIVVMKPAKNVRISDASGHTVVLLEGLSNLPKLLTSSAGNRKKSSANITAERDHSPRVRLGESNIQALLSTTDRQIIRRSMGNNNSPKFHSNLMQYLEENSGVSAKTSSILSPRLQQRKTEAEKQPCPLTPNMNKAQSEHNNRKPVESVSPRHKLRLKQSQVQKREDQVDVDEIICEKRVSSRRNDETSPGSNKSRSFALQSSVLQHRIPSSRASQIATLVLNQKNSAANTSQHISDKEVTSITFEYPSPVSVLDSSCYEDQFSPSPVKRTPDAVKDTEPCTLDLYCHPKNSSKMNDETSLKKLQNFENLVQIKMLKSADAELPTTDFITSKCNMDNPDHNYVSEILLATGILNKDCRVPLQLYTSGHAINPELFGVLEQPKHGWFSKFELDKEETQHQKTNTEKNHRKLVFDVVNEIISHKMESTAYGNGLDLLCQFRRKLSGQQLVLEEVCSQIRRLRTEKTRSTSLEDDVEFIAGEDILHRSEGWVDFSAEQSRVALQIERLIFKDLIDEVLSGVTEAGLQIKPRMALLCPRRFFFLGPNIPQKNIEHFSNPINAGTPH